MNCGKLAYLFSLCVPLKFDCVFSKQRQWQILLSGIFGKMLILVFSFVKKTASRCKKITRLDGGVGYFWNYLYFAFHWDSFSHASMRSALHFSWMAIFGLFNHNVH